MREKAGYRENLEMLMGFFPGKAAVSLADACEVLGIPVSTAKRDEDFPKTKVGKNYKVSVANLARWLS